MNQKDGSKTMVETKCEDEFLKGGCLPLKPEMEELPAKIPSPPLQSAIGVDACSQRVFDGSEFVIQNL